MGIWVVYCERCSSEHVCVCLCGGLTFPFLLGTYLGVELMDLTVILCWAFWGAVGLFSKVAASLYSPPNSVEGLDVSIFPSLHILGLGAPKWTLQRVTRTCHWSPHPGILNATELTPSCLGRPTMPSILLYMCLVSHYPLRLVESTLTRTVDLLYFLNSFHFAKSSQQMRVIHTQHRTVLVCRILPDSAK